MNEITQKNFDIVFFPDIGMSSEFYYLSFIGLLKFKLLHGVTLLRLLTIRLTIFCPQNFWKPKMPTKGFQRN